MRFVIRSILFLAVLTTSPGALRAQITGEITGTDPQTLSFQLLANQSTEAFVNVEVTIPFVPAGPVDVLFLTDTTSSMEEFIQPVRTAYAVAARSLLHNSNLDLRFGVADYKDFGAGGPYDTRGYGVKQKFTDDLTDILAGLGQLSVGGGDGGAEQNLAALRNLGSDWDALDPRRDAQKLVVWLGDAPGFEGFDSYPSLGDTIDTLAGQNVELYAFNPFKQFQGIDGFGVGPKTADLPQASTITDAIGGLTISNAPFTNVDELSSMIQNAILHGATNISQLRLEVEGDLGGWQVEVFPPTLGPFGPDELPIQANFQLLLTAPPIIDTVEVDLVLTADGMELDRLSNHQALMSLTFACILGDMNGDSLVDAFDVSFLEMALADKLAYETMIGIDPDFWADFNGDGVLDAFDVAFFEAGIGLGAAAVTTHLPEPACVALLLISLLITSHRNRNGQATRP